jgi:hypothetical protein
MHPAAARYLAMNIAGQKQVQIFLCNRALQVWERMVPDDLNYCESVAGSRQVLDAHLPREALESVLTGKDGREIDARYREPLVAMQDDDVQLPKEAEFAYYAIYNLFAAHALHNTNDPWLVLNQALAAIGGEKAISALEAAVRAAR